MSTTEEWTVGRLLKWTADYLRDHGSDSPRLDAEILLANARQCKRIELYTAFDEVASETVKQQFRALVKRRAEGAPVAYLVGEREFYSLPFYVTPDVLIPRADSEFLLIRLFDLIKERLAGATEEDRPALQILDLCTGSGCLAIATAVHWPTAHLTAVDISPAALAVARRNAERHGVAERVEFCEGDLWQPIQGRRFDFIISNPPYVTSEEYVGLDREVRDFEPRLALEAGPAGTEVLSRIAQQAPQFLHANGSVLCEISPMLRDATQKLFREVTGLTDVSITKDHEQRARVIGARAIGQGNG